MPGIVTRKREIPKVLTGSQTLYIDGVKTEETFGRIDQTGTQVTVSEGHQVSKLQKSGEDIGGDFFTFKSEVIYNSHERVSIIPQGNISRRFSGAICPRDAKPVSLANTHTSSNAELQAWGATAISRVSPVNSQAEALTSISETLKDGLPAIAGISTWRDRAQLSKGAGSEYLNAQFGWVPLISDIKAVAASYKDAAKILKQLERDAGRNVRRRYQFPTVTENITRKDTSGKYIGASLIGSAALPGGYWDGSLRGRHTIERTITTDRWFSGAFTYHMPATETQLGKVVEAYQMYDRLYGVGLTPDVLWNLTPWSWATDWFANTGDVLSNVSNAMLYGQILRYGYIMEKTTILDVHSVRADDFVLGPGPYTTTVQTTVKRRLRANPFGFGITFDGLNHYQLSILAALGMTKR